VRLFISKSFPGLFYSQWESSNL